MLFRIFLLLGGAFVCFTGLDMALGGIKTMGWLAAPDFVSVARPDVFAVQDNHVRFFGGVWTGIGLFLLLAAAMGPMRFRGPLFLAFALIFIGGLARLSAMEMSLLLGPKLIGSVGLELVGMPLVALWLWWLGRT